MKNFIAINTVTNICRVSLFINNELIQTIEENKEHTQTKYLPLFISRILKENQCTIKDMDFFTVSIGPGSYSGIKVGVNFIKGLSFSTKIPIVPVNQFASFNSVIDNPNYYYVALFSHRENIYFQLYKDGAVTSEQFCDHYTELKEGIKVYGYLLDKINNFNYTNITPSSKNIGYYAQKNYNSLLITNPDNLKSIYLAKKSE